MSKIVVIAAEGCPGCEDLKSTAKTNNFEWCDITKKEECMDLADKAEVMYTPSVLKVDGDKIIKCDLKKENNRPVAYCEGEKYEL